MAGAVGVTLTASFLLLGVGGVSLAITDVTTVVDVMGVT